MATNPSYQPNYQPGDIVYATPIPSAPPSAPPATADPAAIKEFLKGHGWPDGLQDTLIRNLQKIPFRFFICDNSGSMSTNDGHKLVKTSNGTPRFANCTRWAELTNTLTFHAGLARTAMAPTEFRLLNNSPPLLIGDGTGLSEGHYHQFMRVLQEDSPNGGTPLCAHIREVIARIAAMAPQLRANSQKACVVIMTDGESSDGDIAQAMRPLKDLPAWVVVRLCTDEDKIVEYWNNVDEVLELDMDVLDDLQGEAKEIRAVNSWLTYGEPIHRLREFGIPIKEIDLLDEVKLSMDQIRFFVTLLLGGKVDDYPHPEVDWAGFQRVVQGRQDKIGMTHSPIHLRKRHWIRLENVKGSTCSIQ